MLLSQNQVNESQKKKNQGKTVVKKKAGREEIINEVSQIPIELGE